MAGSSNAFQDSLAWLKDARTVMEKARRYREAFPDLGSMAHQAARDYLLKHTGEALDPDQVWWHDFASYDKHGADTFSGWAHRHPPLSSMRFSELWVQRFSQYFQYQDSEFIWANGGFYNQGSDAKTFAAHNEVKLDPRKVMVDFWALDFASVVRARNDSFWAGEGLDLPLLLRIRFIAAIESSLADGLIDADDRHRLWTWMGLVPGHRPTLATLSAPASGSAFTVHGYQMEGAGHLLTLKGRSGRVILYVPTAVEPLRGFDSQPELSEWITQRLLADDAQAWYDGLHVPHGHSDDAQRKAQLQTVRERCGTLSAPRWPFGTGSQITQSLFLELRDWIKEDVQASHRLLVSNGDLRRQHWRDELGLAITVLAVFALVGQPMGMLLLIVGAVRLGLDIDAYVNARGDGQRHEAFSAAIGDLLVVAFSVYGELAQGGPPSAGLEQWDDYMALDETGSDLLSRSVLRRHKLLLDEADVPSFEGHMAPMDEFGSPYVEREGVRSYSFRQEGEVHNNLVEQYSGHMAKVNDLFSIGRGRLAAIPERELQAFLDNLFDSMAQLPRSTASVLWRGGRGPRVTLGARFRAGEIHTGDVLVSTDITSFTESPFIPRRFMLPKDAVDLPLEEVAQHFDDNSVVYELIGDGAVSGVPVAPLSLNWQEAEVLFTPGRYFRIDSVGEISGTHYRFLRFRLREVQKATGQRVYEMRTGLPFDRQAYAERVRYDALVERFFPAAQWT
ncbi:hypothetical protein D3C81_386990 [compost metagenome]